MLNRVLFANGMSCLLFGLGFILFPSKTAQFLGTPPTWIISLLGAGLLANALALFLTARRSTPDRREVLFFIAGDVAWVLATFGLIGFGLWITSSAGIVSAILVALWVGACAYNQMKFLPDAEPAETQT